MDLELVKSKVRSYLDSPEAVEKLQLQSIWYPETDSEWKDAYITISLVVAKVMKVHEEKMMKHIDSLLSNLMVLIHDDHDGTGSGESEPQNQQQGGESGDAVPLPEAAVGDGGDASSNPNSQEVSN
jgi:hypothetical protein